VIYYPGESGELIIDAGVEVPDGFAARDAVRRVDTPAGEVAAVTHFGDYADLAGAYAALQQWCSTSARPPSGTSWEVYGDWEEDPPSGEPTSTSCSRHPRALSRLPSGKTTRGSKSTRPGV
jgi:hypothetical protein